MNTVKHLHTHKGTKNNAVICSHKKTKTTYQKKPNHPKVLFYILVVLLIQTGFSLSPCLTQLKCLLEGIYGRADGH